MKYLTLLAIAVFFCMSVLASLRPEWFHFIYSLPGRDKSMHFLVSGVLTVLVVLGLSRSRFRGRSAGPLVCLLLTTLLVTLEEFTQLAIPTRTFAWLDLGYSYAGILVFGLVALLMMRFIRPLR